jgi:predicted GH43/DUF377 family glycosyl hydrolase
MSRYKGNPILKPIAEHPWESRIVFNAAATYLDNRVHVLYRAIGDDGVSRLGYASSPDGYHFDERLPSPVFEPANAHERWGCEDPRLTPQNGRYIMTYTAFHDRILCAFQIAMTSISHEDFLNKRWNWEERWRPFPGVQNKNAVIFPRKINDSYVMFHRFHPDICVAYSNDLRRWHDIAAVMGPRQGMWDGIKIGAAGPPIKIDEGWLLVYHGVDARSIYRLGVALLDKENPERVIYRSEEPILEPTEDYERFGFVPNVVFSCGAVLLDGQLLIYYGGADTVIGVATFDLNEIIK